MLISEVCAFAASGSAHEVAFLDKERFIDLFDGARVLTHCRSDGLDAHGSTFKFFNNSVEYSIIHVIKAVLIHIECRQAKAGNLHVDVPIAFDLGKVANTTEQ